MPFIGGMHQGMRPIIIYIHRIFGRATRALDSLLSVSVNYYDFLSEGVIVIFVPRSCLHTETKQSEVKTRDRQVCTSRSVQKPETVCVPALLQNSRP